MRLSLILLVFAFGLAGCAHKQTDAKFSGLAVGGAGGATGQTGTNSKLIVTPEFTLTGKVIRVNSGARFVVLKFPIGHMPAVDQQLVIYRRGLKVGDAKVTGPQMDDNIVADLLEGQVEVGDQVRDR
jgi:hypothetical protein